MNQSSLLHKETEEKTPYFLMEYEGTQMLRDLDLPVAESGFATNEREAMKIANEIGYPIVLKGMSKDIIHKSEAGVVRLNIKNEIDLKREYAVISANARSYNANAVLSGVFVQKMAAKGIELIIGIKKDPIFGHQLVIGAGGTLVEVIQDYALRMMPVTELEIEEMVRELKSYPILKGYRGEPGINLDLLKQICMRLNALIQLHPHIDELDLNPVIFTQGKATICDVRIAMGCALNEKGKRRSLTNVDKMLNPKSIAVIGASQDEKKNGGRLFRYLVENKYPGELYPINPKASEIKGYKAYPDLKDVPADIDLACIIVAAPFVPDVLKSCIVKGIKAAIIYSSGFAEIGEEGERLQEEILAIAKEGDIRLLGPNSIGIASPSKQIYTAFGAALESKVKVSGNIGFISQSGAMGSALLSRAWEEGIGFSRWISIANEADLDSSDFIEVLAEDELTNVITVFMEGLQDAEAFKKAVTKAKEKEKPVIVFKTGKSDVGKRAVQSHTGSMAGDDAVYMSAFNKYGVLRVEHIEDLLDTAIALDVQPLPNGNKIGVITASGGACSVIADLCSANGMEVPELSINTMSKIQNLIPPFGSSQNPIDVTAEIIAKPQMFKEVVSTLANDADISGVLVMLTTNADPGASIIAQAILDTYERSDKPIVVGRLGANAIAPQAMQIYAEGKLPVYATPEKAVNIMNYLVKYSELSCREKH
ncbi:acetate--CoA ligase family protein [Sporosarcina sp. 179-K 3D1 HS]|uniref:acetate--CoA ligase family protein n=1 Tax=Sporosarcina sp. 179-K 3D1 HS TaxID=3232169 RepID=UPI0039A0682D